MQKQIVFIGAKSDIVQPLIRLYAEEGYNLVLAGRDILSSEPLKNQLESKYAISVQMKEFDALKSDQVNDFFKGLEGEIFGVICGIGFLGNQEKAMQDPQEAHQILTVNFNACVALLNQAVDRIVNGGFIIGISSVAGDRGRASNFIYGSAKAGFTAYLSGLRAFCFKKNIHVVTVKPGFVATKMTEHLSLPKKLTASKEYVAKTIYKAQRHKKNTVYVKSIWRVIMFVIKHLPEFIFKRLSL